MRVFPGYAGPMADWPTVEAVEGLPGVLHTLRGRYRLALATNMLMPPEPKGPDRG